MMNIPFVHADESMDDNQFLLFCNERGLKTLKGHRSVGGFRASLYNAMPEEGVDALIHAMREFENSKYCEQNTKAICNCRGSGNISTFMALL